VTLPISPEQLAVYNRQGFKGFLKSSEWFVNVVNQRTRVHADAEIIVCRNETRAEWLAEEPIDPPQRGES
jgi:hypothetical protein